MRPPLRLKASDGRPLSREHPRPLQAPAQLGAPRRGARRSRIWSSTISIRSAGMSCPSSSRSIPMTGSARSVSRATAVRSRRRPPRWRPTRSTGCTVKGCSGSTAGSWLDLLGISFRRTHEVRAAVPEGAQGRAGQLAERQPETAHEDMPAVRAIGLRLLTGACGAWAAAGIPGPAALAATSSSPPAPARSRRSGARSRLRRGGTASSSERGVVIALHQGRRGRPGRAGNLSPLGRGVCDAALLHRRRRAGLHQGARVERELGRGERVRSRRARRRA